MNDIMELITNYEEKNDRSCVCITVFSDGSGHASEYDIEIFSFNNQQQLIELLQS